MGGRKKRVVDRKGGNGRKKEKGWEIEREGMGDRKRGNGRKKEEG